MDRFFILYFYPSRTGDYGSKLLADLAMQCEVDATDEQSAREYFKNHSDACLAEIQSGKPFTQKAMSECNDRIKSGHYDKVTIRVITLKQPWAYLFAAGFKLNETRSFNTNFRGEVYIHSSQKIDFNDLELIHQDKFFKKYITERDQLVQGAIIGKVTIVDSVPTEKFTTDFKKSGKDLRYLSAQERAFGNYAADRFAWIAGNHNTLATPIYCRGALGIWKHEVTKELLKEVQHG